MKPRAIHKRGRGQAGPVPRLVVLLKAAKGHHLVDVRTILHVRADARFCCIAFTDGTEKAVFHTLGELETILRCGERIGDLLFVRVHRSFIVAFHYATAIHNKDGVVLMDGSKVPVSRGEWRRLRERSHAIHSV